MEFHPDVDMNTARTLVLGLGIELRDNPDLGSHHLMIHPDVTIHPQGRLLANLSSLDKWPTFFRRRRSL